MKVFLKRFLLSMLLILFTLGANSFSQDFIFKCKIINDKKQLYPGETISWKLVAGVFGEGFRGVSSMDINIYETRDEIVERPYLDHLLYFGDMNFHPTFINYDTPVTHTVKLYYNPKRGYNAIHGNSTIGGLFGIGVKQFEVRLDHGYGMQDLCEGDFTVTKPGYHVLDPNDCSGFIWLDEHENEQSGTGVGSGTSYFVHSYPGAGLSEETLEAFDRIARFWGRRDCSPDNDYCDNTDLNRDGMVDNLDLHLLFTQNMETVSIESDIYSFSEVLTPASTPEAPQSFVVDGEYPNEFVPIENDIYFCANSDDEGFELQRLNADAKSIVSIDLTEDSASSYPHKIVSLGFDLYFVAEFNGSWALWTLKDGLEPLVLKENIHSGETTEGLSVSAFHDYIYFTSIDQLGKSEIWITDGTIEGTLLIGEFGEAAATPDSFPIINDKLILEIVEEGALFLYAFDGVSFHLINNFGSERISNYTVMNDTLFFRTETTLWKSDGLVADMVISDSMIMTDGDSPFPVLNEELYFVIQQPANKTLLYRTNGTDYYLVKEFSGTIDTPSLSNFVPGTDRLFFSFTPALQTTAELWETDGSTFGTKMLHQFTENAGTVIEDMLSFFNKLYFLFDGELYRMGPDKVLSKVRLSGTMMHEIQELHSTQSDKLILFVDTRAEGAAVWIYAP